MKKLHRFLTINAAVIFLLAIAVMAIGLRRLDSSRVPDKQSVLGQFIKESALPFKNLKSTKKSKLDKADSPDLASLQDFFMTMDPAEQRVPAERLPLAYNALVSMKDKQFKSGGYQLNWTGTDVLMGGRTRTIMWDPLVNNKVWAGSVTGGLWYNDDITFDATSWQPVNDLWDNLVISSITFDPNTPLTMYVGTGEAQTAIITYRESSGRGVGIWKTTDGGQNWSLLPSTSQFAYVTKVVVRNESGNSVIYAGVVSGYYHGIQQSAPSDGLYRSADGGVTWQQVLPDITGYSVPYPAGDVTLGADGRIYVGTMQNVAGKGGGVVLYSDNGTPGSWTKYETVANLIQSGFDMPLPGRVMLATAASDANILYAAFAAGVHSPGTQPVYKGKYIYRSDNKGVTWYPISLPGGNPDWANLAWHAMVIAVDPANPDLVYAGGLDQWRTTDAGTTWSHLSDWALMYYGGGADYIHADQHCVVYKPGTSNTIMFGTDGGVFYTSNGNAASPVFKQKNMNYNTLQFYSGAIHPGAEQNKFMGGLQDNGTLMHQQGVPLSIDNMITGGDGAYCFWDKETPSVYFTSIYYNWYYMFNNNSQVNAAGYYRSGVFINPADYYSPENTLFANATDFWGGMADSLLVINNIPSDPYVYFIEAGTGSSSYFSHVKVSPFSIGFSPNLFLGTVTGKLYKISDALLGPVTTEIGSPSFPAGNISSVSIGRSEDTLLVTFSNYGVSSIWQTYNGGQQWREVEGNLPDMPVRWAIYHPQNTRQALIATELGVWSSSNLNETNVNWIPQTEGMANVRVDMLTLRTSDNTVLAASHGRGLFTCTFNLDLTTSLAKPSVAQNPFSVLVTQAGIEITSTSVQPSDYVVYTVSGSEIFAGKLAKGILKKTINTDGVPHGVYLVKIQSGNQKMVKKVVL
jgi:hypothetical protein